jgi:L-cysteine desulfidase
VHRAYRHRVCKCFYARDVLGVITERIEVHVSGNILKNVKGVIVPNTNGLKGVKAAAIIGMLGGNPKKGMEVLADVKLNTYLNVQTY